MGTKKCPFCAEKVKTEAIKCKHCGSKLPTAPTVLEQVMEEQERGGSSGDMAPNK